MKYETGPVNLKGANTMATRPMRMQREMSIEKLFGLVDPPPVKSLYSYEGTNGKLDVPSESITMVLSRDVRANVRIGAEMALSIARENPQRDVWYVNTYAGIALMKDAFREALTNAAMPMPEPDYTSDEEPGKEEAKPKSIELRLGPDPSRPWEKWVPGTDKYAHLWYRISNYEEDMRLEREHLAKLAAEQAAAMPATETVIPVKPHPVLPNLHLF